ncbi:Gfo/Idh/MocA family oxidoreductase [candidate division KSB1 bacterium]|nr:Gfo/Idh/MocA family oxidoreductase [candidate division KSB1 bacterium]
MSQNAENQNKLQRRDFLKAVLPLPIVGGVVAGYLSKRSFDRRNRNTLFSELGLDLEIEPEATERPQKPGGDSIRLGIIGVGRRAENILVSLGFGRQDQSEATADYTDLNVTLAGVCDVYDPAAEKGIALSQYNRFAETSKRMPAAKRYRHYHDMLDSKDIDAVIIATPDHWHERMVVDAAAAGKHIYCEKCLTRTIEEAFRVRDVIKRSSVVFQYGHQNRQQYAFRVARKIIDKNILGQITLIKTHTNRNTPSGAWLRHLDRSIEVEKLDWKHWLGPAPLEPFTPSRYWGWQKFFEYSGGLPAHMFSHEYDAVNQVMNLGIPKSVMASGGIYYWKDDRNTPDVFQAIFDYPQRNLLLTYDATLACSSTGEYESGAKVKEVYGSDAWMKLGMDIHVIVDRHSKRFKTKIADGLMKPSIPFLSYTPGANLGQFDMITSASQRYYVSQGLVYTYQDGKKIDVTYLHVKEWLDCIRTAAIPSCDIDHAFEDAITCLMATKSYQEGRKVEWDETRQRVV